MLKILYSEWILNFLYKILYFQIAIWITSSVNLIFDRRWKRYYRVWLDHHVLVS
jgi:hypothetical protein